MCLSVCECAYFPFDYVGGILDLIILVPDHCLSLYFKDVACLVNSQESQAQASVN